MIVEIIACFLTLLDYYIFPQILDTKSVKSFKYFWYQFKILQLFFKLGNVLYLNDKLFQICNSRIDHKQQRQNMTTDILKEECTPCLTEESQESCGSIIFGCVSSEAFLLSLHLTALAFGVAKEAVRMKEADEILHLIHSTIETFLACLQVGILLSCQDTF